MSPGLNYFRFDLYTAILLVGAVQGFFLTLLFLLRQPHRQPYHYLLLAGFVCTVACIVLEIFLCYSGLMFRMLPLVDFSEPFNFAVGPLTYLLFRSLGGRDWASRQWLHLVPFAFYFLYHLLFMVQPEAVKYNAYLSAYFPAVARIPARFLIDPDPFYLSGYDGWLMLVHITSYIIACYWLIRQPSGTQVPSAYFHSWTRALFYFYAAMLLLFLFVKFYFQEDLGDHFLAALLVVQLFFISYKLLTGSAFFQPVVQVKYEKSALSDEAKQDLLHKLKRVEEERFYTQPSASLPGLARQLNTSPHYLSQSLNECLGKSFFEYLAELRIQEAKAILSDPARQHLKIEEVAEQTGYLSKSAFSSAFKKQTGQTPGQYRSKAIAGVL